MPSPEEFPGFEGSPGITDVGADGLSGASTDEDAQAELLDSLATEFLDRYRQGERPFVAEYAERYPELAEDIRDLFPTIGQMEGLKVELERPTVADPGSLPPRGRMQLTELGDFRIIREIGRGGMGVVYEAEQSSLGRRVALKVLPLLSMLNPELIRRFQREARTAGRLHHSNIVPVFGVGESHGFHYYVMQMIDGVGLDTLIDERSSTVSMPDARRTLEENESDAVRRPSQDMTAAESRFASSPPTVERSQDDTGPLTSRDSLADVTEPSNSSESPDGRLIPVEGVVRAPIELTLSATIQIGIQTADALQYAHDNGILHRDIKPGNLLLDQQGSLWVADFGLAKAIETDDITASGHVVGTVRYMAPEALQGQADPRGDVYSLGVTLYELLVRRRAWGPTDRTNLIEQILNAGLTPLRKLDSSIPRDLETVVLKATAREVQHRYQTAREFSRDLQNILEDRPIAARRVSPAEKLWRWSRRNPVVSSLSGISVALLLLVAVVASVGYEAERQQRQRAENTSNDALLALDEIFEQFAPDRPTSPASVSLGEQGGDVQVPAVVSPESAALLENLLKFYDRLADAAGDNPDLTLKCASALRRVGDIHQRLGQYDESIDSYEQAVALYQQIENSGGDRATELLITRVGVMNEIGLAQRLNGQDESARASHRQAISTLEELPTDIRQQPDAQYELARSCYLLASRPQPGDSPLSDLEEIFSDTSFDRPGGPPPRDRDIRDRPGRDGFPPPRRPNGPQNAPRVDPHELNSEDRALFARANKILRQLNTDFPDAPRYRYLLAVCLRESNPARRPGEDPGNEMTPEKLLDSLVDEFPKVPEYRHALAVTWSRVNTFQLASRSLEPVLMEDCLTRAREYAHALVADYPTVPAYTSTLIHIHRRLSHVQEQVARDFVTPAERTSVLRESERNLREAIDLQRSLVRRMPDALAWRLWLARFQQRLGRSLREQYRDKESRDVLEDAIEQLEASASANDLPDAAIAQLATLYLDLSRTCDALEDADGVINARLASDDYRRRLPQRPRTPHPRPRPGDFNGAQNRNPTR